MQRFSVQNVSSLGTLVILLTGKTLSSRFFNEKFYQNVLTSFPFSNDVSLVLRELAYIFYSLSVGVVTGKKKPGVR